MALTDQEKVYNLALNLISEHAVTEGLTTEKQYVICARHYEDARKEAMVLHPWNEAKTRTILMQDTSAPLFGYAYQYTQPTDCLRVWTINSEETGWEIEGTKIVTDHYVSPAEYDANSIDYLAGQYLSYDDVTYLVDSDFTSSAWATDTSYVTSQGDDYNIIQIEYVYDLETIASWGPMLKKVVSYILAIKVAPGILNDPKSKTKTALIDEFTKLVLPTGKSIDSQQGTLKPYFLSEWLHSRS